MADAGKTLPTRMQSAHSDAGGGIIVCFSGFGLGHLIAVKANVNVTTYKDISDNCMLPTLCQQFGGRPFPVPARLPLCTNLSPLRHGVMSLVCGGTPVACTQP